MPGWFTFIPGGKTRLPMIAYPRLISHLDIAWFSKHLSTRAESPWLQAGVLVSWVCHLCSHTGPGTWKGPVLWGSAKVMLTFFFFLGLLGPPLWHMEIPRMGVKSELQLPAYTTAPATPDPSHACNLHHSSLQHRILNPLNEARDRTFVLVVTSQICSSEPQWELPVLTFLIISKQKALYFGFALGAPTNVVAKVCPGCLSFWLRGSWSESWICRRWTVCSWKSCLLWLWFPCLWGGNITPHTWRTLAIMSWKCLFV